MIGAGLGARAFTAVVFGLIFGGVPMLIVQAFTTGLVAWGVTAVALLAAVVGYRIGRGRRTARACAARAPRAAAGCGAAVASSSGRLVRRIERRVIGQLRRRQLGRRRGQRSAGEPAADGRSGQGSPDGAVRYGGPLLVDDRQRPLDPFVEQHAAGRRVEPAHRLPTRVVAQGGAGDRARLARVGLRRQALRHVGRCAERRRQRSGLGAEGIEIAPPRGAGVEPGKGAAVVAVDHGVGRHRAARPDAAIEERGVDEDGVERIEQQPVARRGIPSQHGAGQVLVEDAGRRRRRRERRGVAARHGHLCGRDRHGHGDEPECHHRARVTNGAEGQRAGHHEQRRRQRERPVVQGARQHDDQGHTGREPSDLEPLPLRGTAAGDDHGGRRGDDRERTETQPDRRKCRQEADDVGPRPVVPGGDEVVDVQLLPPADHTATTAAAADAPRERRARTIDSPRGPNARGRTLAASGAIAASPYTPAT